MPTGKIYPKAITRATAELVKKYGQKAPPKKYKKGTGAGGTQPKDPLSKPPSGLITKKEKAGSAEQWKRDTGRQSPKPKHRKKKKKLWR